MSLFENLSKLKIINTEINCKQYKKTPMLLSKLSITKQLGVIIKNVSSSVFCVVKRNKKCIENRF
jgi:hypothetical protein